MTELMEFSESEQKESIDHIESILAAPFCVKECEIPENTETLTVRSSR